jgi:hypothetical protein
MSHYEVTAKPDGGHQSEASIANLEAQLEQRQKQYEYYREKLLTFER